MDTHAPEAFVSTASPARLEWVARSLEAQAIVTYVATLLEPTGIDVMPLKGVLLDALEPTMIGLRYLGDVDVLVSRLSDALAILRRDGWQVVGSSAHATTLVAPRFGLYLDLHSEVTSTIAYELTARHLLMGGRRDRTTFRAPVVIPSPLDEFAHLVAHFTQGRHGAADVRHLADFQRVANRAGLTPPLVAQHLDRLGLGRAARYVLGTAASLGDSFAEAIVENLANDPLGDLITGICRRGLAAFPPPAKVGAIFPPLLARSLPRGLGVAVAHLVDAATRGSAGPLQANALRARWAFRARSRAEL